MALIAECGRYKAVKNWHLQIQENQAEAVSFERCKVFLAVVGDKPFVTSLFEHSHNETLVGHSVYGEQNAPALYNHQVRLTVYRPCPICHT